MTSLAALIKRGTAWNIQRCSIKRVLSDGTYDTAWVEITPYVVQYPIITKSYSDTVYLGDYRIDAGQIVLNNTTRYFNEITDSSSIFYGCATRNRTKIKLECNFIDDDDTEISGLTFYGVFYSEPLSSDSGLISFSVASVLKAFQNYTAYGVDVTGAPSSSTMIDRLVKLTSNGTRIFDRYLEGVDDATRYQINPNSYSLTLSSIASPSVAANDTIWAKIADYSFCEGFFPDITSTGNFLWDKRQETSGVQWVFNGAGSQDNDYGINIVSVDRYSDGTNNIWTRFALTYDNAGSVSTVQDSWTPGDLSTTDIYGVRTYSKTILDLNGTTATTVATALQSDYKRAHRELDITTVFIPQLNLNDKVTVNYEGQNSVANPFIIGASLLGPSSNLLGQGLGSIYIRSGTFKIIGISHNINCGQSGQIISKFTLREVL